MRGVTILVGATMAALAACGGGRAGARSPTGGGAGDAAGAVVDAGVDEGAARADAAPDAAVAPPAPAAITRDECGQLVERMLAIGLAEQRAKDPRAPQATAAQQADIRARLLEQAVPACAAMTRASWQCAVAAADRAAMTACSDP